jgi:hypothetical protein
MSLLKEGKMKKTTLFILLIELLIMTGCSRLSGIFVASPIPSTTVTLTPLPTKTPSLPKTFGYCTLPKRDVSNYVPINKPPLIDPATIDLKSGGYHMLYFYSPDCQGSITSFPRADKLANMYADTISFVPLDTTNPQVQLITSQLGMAGMSTPSVYIVDPNGKTIFSYGNCEGYECEHYIEISICYPQNGPYHFGANDLNYGWEIRSTVQQRIERYTGTYRLFWFYDQASNNSKDRQSAVRTLQGMYGDRIAFIYINIQDSSYKQYIDKYNRGKVARFVVVDKDDKVVKILPQESVAYGFFSEESLDIYLRTLYLKAYNENSALVPQYDTNLDWAGIQVVLTDPTGDSLDGADKDITAIYQTSDDKYWYFLIDTAENLTQEGGAIDMQFISSDAEGSAIYTGIVIRPNDPSVYYSNCDGCVQHDTNSPIADSWVGWNNVIEFAISKNTITNSSSIQLDRLFWNVLGPNGYFSTDYASRSGSTSMNNNQVRTNFSILNITN